MTGGGEDDDSVFDVLDEYGVEYQRERRHGKRWVQIRAGYQIGPHIVDGLRAFGYRLDGFASDTTMNFVKVEHDNGGGVRGRREIEEKREEVTDTEDIDKEGIVLERLDYLLWLLEIDKQAYDSEGKDVPDRIREDEEAIHRVKELVRGEVGDL